MILEHLVDELATFLNEKNGLVSSAAGEKSGAKEESKVEIYELMQDEPDDVTFSSGLSLIKSIPET